MSGPYEYFTMPATLTPPQREEERAILAALAAFDKAWVAGDLDAVLALYTDDVTAINPFGRVLRGREESERVLGAQMKALKGGVHVMKPTALHFVADGVALVDADMEVGGFELPDGRTVPVSKGRGTMVLRKEGGRWRLADVRGYLPPLPPPNLGGPS